MNGLVYFSGLSFTFLPKMPRDGTRTRKHEKRKRKEDNRSTKCVHNLQALLPLTAHELCRTYTSQSSTQNTNTTQPTLFDVCNKMKLIDVNVVFNGSKSSDDGSNKTNEVQKTPKEKETIVFSPSNENSRSQRRHQILLPRPPPMETVDEVILCSPCSNSLPSFHDQDSLFSLNSKSRTPIKGKSDSCSQKTSKVRLSFFDRISSMSKTLRKQQPNEAEKIPNSQPCTSEPKKKTILRPDDTILFTKIAKLETELRAKDEEISSLKAKVVLVQKNNSHLRQEKFRNQLRLDDMKIKKERTIMVPNLPKFTSGKERDAAFKTAIEQVSKLCYPYARRATKTKKILDLLESGALFKTESFMAKWKYNAAKKLTRATFSPPLVLQAIDDSEEGGWNISGAACYRNIEQLKKYDRGFLFSKGPIIKAAKDLENEAKKIVDFKLVKEERICEHVEYSDFGKIIVEDIKAHGLEHKALTEGVLIGARSDGADFSRSRGHTSTGWRILDIGAKVPGTDKPFFNNGLDELNRQKLKNYHTKDICNFLCMSQCKETKKNYHEDTKHVFDFLLDADKNGIKQDGKTYHINMCFPADQSCHWKVLGMGGACKVANLFCHLCGCSSQDCAQSKTGLSKCSWCIKKKNECYHYDLDTEKEIEQKKQKIAILKRKYPYLSNLENDPNSPFAEFKSDVNDVNKSTNPMHIDFVGANRQEKLDFSSTLNHQLQMRGLSYDGSKIERLERLRAVLYDQHFYLTTCSTIKRYKDSRKYRLLPVDWCIPCIMHLHNRIVEKILFMLIKKGYSKRKSNDQKEEFISAVEGTMNSCVLGSEFNETHWKIPLNETKTDISSGITLTNMQSKKVIALIHLLLADVFDEEVENWESQLEQWTNVIHCFTELDKLMNSRVEFTDTMIEEFQSLADSFFKSWVDLNEREGITNYIHLLGAGHLSQFLYKYRNLYKYSQQGWEHSNKKVTGVYHKHTQKGGHGSKLSERSQLFPVFRFCVRKWMWSTKHAHNFFNIPY